VAREVVLSLVSHTNVGKTTLARTLLRRDVGEVFDHAHVTEETERFVLLEIPSREEPGATDRVVLADNPGFGDSARLAARLRGRDNPLGWLVAQVWDRFADRALFCSQQAVRHVRDEADVVLYLVNASEDPEAAGYVAPELEILGWIGRPVVVLLNQTGVAGDAAARAADVARWRTALAEHPVVRETLALDAFTRCWVQEGLLFEKLRELVAEERRDLLDALLARWREEQLAALRDAVGAMAELVAVAATDREPVTRSAFGAAERKRAAEALARRLENAMAETNDALIAGHGLTGEAAEELRVELADVSGGEAATAGWRNPMVGGLVGGALGGLVADLAHGGLTLGGGMLAGALLGAAGARGLSVGMELLRGESASRAVWSLPFLERLCTDTLLRYLAVAHFGRGAGQYRVREHPATWRAVVERALARERAPLRDTFARAREEPGAEGRREITLDCVPPLTTAVRAALAELYPEALGLLNRSGGASTGATAGASSIASGVDPT
jgi:hypothetical protein